jgi:dipeptidyl-peptidase-4
MINKWFVLCVLLTGINIISAQQQLSIEKIWKNGEFGEKGVSGFNGLKNGEEFTKLNQGVNGSSITIHNYKNYKGEGKKLVASEQLIYQGKTLKIDDYSFSADETKILLSTSKKPIYRRSFTANYFIFDLKTNKISQLDSLRTESTLATFSPDGKKIAYIYQNNLFTKDLTTNIITQVTTDGKKNEIINGTTDWVYEEEFAITKAFDWSFDSKKIAYLRFDESQVKQFNIDYFGKTYPTIYTYKYPKAGEANSKVSAFIFDVTTMKSNNIKLNDYEYIPRLQWANTSNTLILLTLNRHQNDLTFYKVEASTNDLKISSFYNEKSETYIEIDDNLIILPNGKEIIRTSEISGYKHIYKLSFDGQQTAITNGNWDVIELYGVDNKATTLFYSAAEKGPINKGVYSINLNGKNKKALSQEIGTNEAKFAQGMNYFVLEHSDANTPSQFELRNKEGVLISIMEDNNELKEKIKFYKLATKEFYQVKHDGIVNNAWIMKPFNFDQSKKYPVFIHVYGGPGHNTVVNGWGGNDFMFHQYLTQQGYIVVSVDPRGTQYNGVKHKKATYLQMGKLELEDFIATAKELKTRSYIDSNRIGIQGWSYGGFMSSLAISKGAEHFKMAIAVAPVTNWKYYDNIYTERFMRTPQENQSGYEDNSPIKHIKNIKGKYLLIHGTADDNVHFQNAMELTNALINANIQFEQFSYPNKNHGIYGGNTRNHLYQMIYNFISKNL